MEPILAVSDGDYVGVLLWPEQGVDCPWPEQALEVPWFEDELEELWMAFTCKLSLTLNDHSS